MKKPRNKRRKNPPVFLTDHQMGQIAGDLVIERNFGVFGLLLSHGMPKLREAMLMPKLREVPGNMLAARTDEFDEEDR